MKKSVQKFAIRALSFSMALQLVTATSSATLAEVDSIANTTVPLAAPSSTNLVKRIWSSLDVRKLKRTQGEGTKTAADTGLGAPAKASDAASSSAPQNNRLAAGTTCDTKTTSEVQAPGWNTTACQNKTTGTELREAPSTWLPELSQSAETAAVAQETGATTVSTGGDQSAGGDDVSTGKDSSDKPAFTVGNNGRLSIASQVLALPPGSASGGTAQFSAEPIVVDSDEAEEVEATIKYEDLPTDESLTKVKAGAKFPIVIASQITSKTAKKGDPIQGRLKYDLKIADRLVAQKGSVVNGHVNYVLRARTILGSMVSKERWYRNSGALGLSFDEIINEKGEHLPLNAQPARASRIVKNKAEGRELGVNHNGQVTGPWGPQLRHKAIRIGLNFALAPAGVFTFGAMPVALGVIGAANPSFAFSKPVGLNVRHRRLKGFAWGFLSGIPGSWLIEDTTVKGQEAVIKPGDEFYAEFCQEFTGEPASDAQLVPGAATKLHGQVLTDPKKKGKNK